MIRLILIRLIAMPLIAAATLVAQPIESYKLDRSPGAITGTLIVTVRNRELSVSNRAIKVWDAWTPTRLIYTQLDPSAADGASQPQAIRFYDAPSVASRTLTVENASITDVTHVLLGADSVGGDVAFVISMRDSKGVPWIAFANEKSGVYRREPYAVPGPITRDLAEIRHIRPEDVPKANGDFSRIPPARISTARLLPGEPSPVGTWVSSDSADRRMTLTIHRGGKAEWIVEAAGLKKATPPCTWSQSESNLNLEFPPPPGAQPISPITWELKSSELVPKSWDREEYGPSGPRMKKAGPGVSSTGTSK